MLQIDSEIVDGRAQFESQEGGVFVTVKNNDNVVLIASLVAVLAIVIIIVVATVLYFRSHPHAMVSVRRQFTARV